MATSELSPAARSLRSSSPDESLIAAAWVTVFLLPLIGFICGVILVAKGQVGHGVGSMLTSLLMCFIWVAVLWAFVG